MSSVKYEELMSEDSNKVTTLARSSTKDSIYDQYDVQMVPP